MSGREDITHDCTTTPTVVDDAVGMPCRQWYIAIVNNRSEKKDAEKLSRIGIETYLPIQKEMRVWKNGRRSKVETVLIPSKLFIHCTEQQRRELVALPYIFRFMTNKASGSRAGGNHQMATVSDDEIARLKFMLGVSNAKVTFAENFAKGQKVEVVRGPFKGLVGEVLHDTDGKTARLYINITGLGSASVQLNSLDVEPLHQS